MLGAGGWCWLWIDDLGLQRETQAFLLSIQQQVAEPRERVPWLQSGHWIQPKVVRGGDWPGNTQGCKLGPWTNCWTPWISTATPLYILPWKLPLHTIVFLLLLQFLFSFLQPIANHFLLSWKQELLFSDLTIKLFICLQLFLFCFVFKENPHIYFNWV